MPTVNQGGRQLSVGNTTARVLRGEEDLSKWTEQELMYGARHLRNGRWPRKPKVVATAIHDELIRRRMKRAIRLLQKTTPRAIKVLIEIALDKEAANRDRIKAAELILDRALGKAVQPIDMNLLMEGEPLWKKVMATAIINREDQELPPALPAGDVIDVDAEIVEGELVEEEEDGDNPRPPAPMRVRSDRLDREVLVSPWARTLEEAGFEERDGVILPIGWEGWADDED